MASIVGYLIVAVVMGVASWWWLRRGAALRRRATREAVRAAKSFQRERAALTERFLAVASRSGKPRGLTWVGCRPVADSPLYARDAASGELYALQAIEVTFEAIKGGDMEEVEAVGNVRAATAVFSWRAERWETDGRVVFNLEPQETLERFGKTLNTCD